MKRRLRANLRTRAESRAVFGERVRLSTRATVTSARSMKVEDVDSARPGEDGGVLQVEYRQRADFTFFFVGAFDVRRRSHRCSRPISASLPSPGQARRQPYSNVRLEFPTEVEGEEIVNKGQEPKARPSSAFFAIRS
jgi:hypothetical protein